MKSPIYWHPWVYRKTMQVLFWRSGHDLKKEYRVIAKEVGNLGVLDVCCGDCYFKKFVPENEYRGVDFNENFVEWAKRKGIKAERKDVLNEELPKEDCVIMLGSLCQFLPNNHKLVLRKMLKAAGKKVIVSEPVENISSGRIGWIGKLLSAPGGEYDGERFSRKTLVELYKKFNAAKIIDVGRHVIGVFEKEK